MGFELVLLPPKSSMQDKVTEKGKIVILHALWNWKNPPEKIVEAITFDNGGSRPS